MFISYHQVLKCFVFGYSVNYDLINSVNQLILTKKKSGPRELALDLLTYFIFAC